MQLPNESRLFTEVDRFWRKAMRNIKKRPNIVEVISQEGIMDQFLNANLKLDKIQKQLEEYLETKRAVFPRFYFLSNSALHTNWMFGSVGAVESSKMICMLTGNADLCYRSMPATCFARA